MAASPSTMNRLQTSVPSTLAVSGSRITTVTTTPRPSPSRQPAPRRIDLLALKEPEDAWLTGGTRSLDRRLLALNLGGTLPKLAAKSDRTAATPRGTAAA